MLRGAWKPDGMPVDLELTFAAADNPAYGRDELWRIVDAGRIPVITIEVQESAWISRNRDIMAEIKAGLKGAGNARQPLTNRPGISRRSALGIVRIPLRDGKTLLLDEEDAERFAGQRFHLLRPSGKNRNNHYVKTKGSDGRPRFVHRLVIGANPGEIVDHIDGDGLNNTRANLRIVSNAENCQKRSRLGPNNTSGYLGVFFESRSGRWVSQAGVDYRAVRLGLFASPEEAARAYDAFVRERFGPLAAVNFPGEPPDPLLLRNARKHRFSNNTSGYRGVTWHRQRERWMARIQPAIDGKRRSKERACRSAEEAARAYDEMARGYWGDRAMLNFPEESA